MHSCTHRPYASHIPEDVESRVEKLTLVRWCELMKIEPCRIERLNKSRSDNKRNLNRE